MTQHTRQLAAVWNWLPAFRAVAETEHLQQAARALHTSPSAVSRTIRLLEDAIAQPLFHRAGRGLRLTGAGQDLLAAVRDAMACIDAGLAIIGPDEGACAGPVRICSTGPVTLLYLLPALQRLRGEHPGLVPVVEQHEPSACVHALLAGQLDVAFLHVAAHHPQLSCVRVGTFTNGVYCGPAHPLHGGAPTMATLLEQPFAVPVADDGTAAPCDSWPAELPRRAGAYVVDVTTSLELVERGDLLAVLPDALARRSGRLCRLRIDVVPPTIVHALRRGAGARAPIVDRIVDAVVGELHDHDSHTAVQSL